MCRTFPPFRLQPPVVASGVWSGFDPEPTTRPAGRIPRDQGVIWASPPLGGWPRQPAEASSSSYGPAVHLQLLSTPSREDAVTFDFNVQTQLGKDFHLADSTHLQAHECGDSSPLSSLDGTASQPLGMEAGDRCGAKAAMNRRTPKGRRKCLLPMVPKGAGRYNGSIGFSQGARWEAIRSTRPAAFDPTVRGRNRRCSRP